MCIASMTFSTVFLSSSLNSFTTLSARVTSSCLSISSSSRISQNLPAGVPSVPSVKPKPDPVDAFDALFDKYEVRIGGYISNAKGRFMANIEAMDSSFHLKEIFTTDEVSAMGWKLELKPYGIEARKGEVVRLLRIKPIDPFGRVSDNSQRAMHPATGSGLAGGEPGASARVPRVVYVEPGATWSNPGAGVEPVDVREASDRYDRGVLIQRSKPSWR